MTLRWGIGIAATLVVAATLTLLAWIGGELHYQSCLGEVQLRDPVGYTPQYGLRPAPSKSAHVVAAEGDFFNFYPRIGIRDRAISRCSRWP
jgi:hypothetical protein